MNNTTFDCLPTLPECPTIGFWFVGTAGWLASKKHSEFLVMCHDDSPQLVKVRVMDWSADDLTDRGEWRPEWVILAPMTADEISMVTRTHSIALHQ